MVDTRDLKSLGPKPAVRVRVSPWAPILFFPVRISPFFEALPLKSLCLKPSIESHYVSEHTSLQSSLRCCAQKISERLKLTEKINLLPVYQSKDIQLHQSREVGIYLNFLVDHLIIFKLKDRTD
jgi:hypothetical protein